MAKYVIDTVELKKRQYVIEAFSEKSAIEKMEDSEPVTQEVLSDTIFNIHIVNEYEFEKDYKSPQRDMFDHPWKKPGHPWNQGRNPRHLPK
tara:strand:+ start:49 stop:321 length:273 start_codon:yes stop_codon:yes gene_type:complete